MADDCKNPQCRHGPDSNCANPAHEDKSANKITLYCSFCGKSQHEVRRLIAGPCVYVCDECVRICADIINEETQIRVSPPEQTEEEIPVSERLSCGDVVVMKSGGPAMTVEKTNPGATVIECVWFGADNNLHRDSFTASSLEKKDPN